MTDEQRLELQLKRLRAPFPKEAIGKLPRSTSRENKKGKCSECGGYHGLPAVHLDYVGHAAVTDRLLEVDPGWAWEPFAVDTDGAPLIKNDGHNYVLWIRLTVAGVTRIGVGTVDMSGNRDPMKELISDALRNAAMRFGVALDLWSKEDLLTQKGIEPAEKATEAPRRQEMPAEVAETVEAHVPPDAALSMTRDDLKRFKGLSALSEELRLDILRRFGGRFNLADKAVEPFVKASKSEDEIRKALLANGAQSGS